MANAAVGGDLCSQPADTSEVCCHHLYISKSFQQAEPVTMYRVLRACTPPARSLITEMYDLSCCKKVSTLPWGALGIIWVCWSFSLVRLMKGRGSLWGRLRALLPCLFPIVRSVAPYTLHCAVDPPNGVKLGCVCLFALHWVLNDTQKYFRSNSVFLCSCICVTFCSKQQDVGLTPAGLRTI